MLLAEFRGLGNEGRWLGGARVHILEERSRRGRRSVQPLLLKLLVAWRLDDDGGCGGGGGGGVAPRAVGAVHCTPSTPAGDRGVTTKTINPPHRGKCLSVWFRSSSRRSKASCNHLPSLARDTHPAPVQLVHRVGIHQVVIGVSSGVSGVGDCSSALTHYRVPEGKADMLEDLFGALRDRLPPQSRRAQVEEGEYATSSISVQARFSLGVRLSILLLTIVHPSHYPHHRPSLLPSFCQSLSLRPRPAPTTVFSYLTCKICNRCSLSSRRPCEIGEAHALTNTSSHPSALSTAATGRTRLRPCAIIGCSRRRHVEKEDGWMRRMWH